MCAYMYVYVYICMYMCGYKIDELSDSNQQIRIGIQPQMWLVTLALAACAISPAPLPEPPQASRKP